MYELKLGVSVPRGLMLISIKGMGFTSSWIAWQTPTEIMLKSIGQELLSIEANTLWKGKQKEVIGMELLKKLSQTPGISGREERIRAVIKEELEGLADEVRVDALGNVIALKKGKT